MTVADDYFAQLAKQTNRMAAAVTFRNNGVTPDPMIDLQAMLTFANGLNLTTATQLPNGRTVVVLPGTPIDTLMAAYAGLWKIYHSDIQVDTWTPDQIKAAQDANTADAAVAVATTAVKP